MKRVSSLTARENEVLVLVAGGKRNREVALTLGITENTVETHLKRIYKKLQVSGRVEAVLYWINQASADEPS